jgi:anti-anti-sigma regulatory factor
MTCFNVQVMQRDVLLVSPDRSITYPSAEYVKEQVTKASEFANPDMLIVVDGRAIHNIDSTAVKVNFYLFILCN